jgi:hypothetical protein
MTTIPNSNAPRRTALRLHPVGTAEDLPRGADILRDKSRLALSRFRDREPDAGFEMYPDEVPGTRYVMG